VDEDEIRRYLCAAVQALLPDQPDGELRLPVTTLDSNEDKAVSVDLETEPGTIIYSIVPYPEEPS
jgi:hypothetical protein